MTKKKKKKKMLMKSSVIETEITMMMFLVLSPKMNKKEEEWPPQLTRSGYRNMDFHFTIFYGNRELEALFTVFKTVFERILRGSSILMVF